MGRQRQYHLAQGTDAVQIPLCCSHAKEVKGRGRRAVLSPWRKCRHGGSALTLLTRQFLNMRSFWTADLNITVLRGRNGSNGASYSPYLARKTRKHDTHLTAILKSLCVNPAPPSARFKRNIINQSVPSLVTISSAT